ncbi:MFS transporter [Aeromicrobium sp. UC242_57]|uniref:MFS transporter n=1 Tax=Aeromicrobium sp. UC242_57 TaxID=3374624 RepID=UPI0037BE9A93
MTTTSTRPERLWFGPHGPVVAGIFALAFLVAFEALAVATVMPEVARQLDGLQLYALAFAAPIAVGIVSMTVAGPEIDRHGPGRALRTGVAVFSAGLFVAGLSTTMPMFLFGRIVQGLGMGLVSVGLYVVIGRTFPEHLRARVFTVLTSAWLLPALVGPVIAGFIAEAVGWRWVFLAVPGLAVVAMILIRSALGAIDGDPHVRPAHRQTWWSVLIAGGILAVSVAGQRTYVWWPALLVGGFLLVVVNAPRLLPPGTWRGRRGLPSVIAVRGLLSAGYFSAETYVPLSLVEHRGLTVTQAGLFLTSAAVLWFTGSWLAAHVPALASKALRVRLGALGGARGDRRLVPDPGLVSSAGGRRGAVERRRPRHGNGSADSRGPAAGSLRAAGAGRQQCGDADQRSGRAVARARDRQRRLRRDADDRRDDGLCPGACDRRDRGGDGRSAGHTRDGSQRHAMTQHPMTQHRRLITPRSQRDQTPVHMKTISASVHDACRSIFLGTAPAT